MWEGDKVRERERLINKLRCNVHTVVLEKLSEKALPFSPVDLTRYEDIYDQCIQQLPMLLFLLHSVTYATATTMDDLFLRLYWVSDTLSMGYSVNVSLKGVNKFSFFFLFTYFFLNFL